MPSINTKRIIRELDSSKVAPYTRRQLDELIRLYRRAERDLQRTLLGVGVSELSRARAKQLERQVGLILAILQKQTQEWAERVTPVSYSRGVDVARRQLLRLGIADTVNPFTQIHTSAMSVIADSVALDTARGLANIKATSGDFIMKTQLSRIADKQLKEMVASGIITGASQRQTAKRALEELQSLIVNGDMIRVGTKSYKASDYIELVVRTRTREAVTEGIINTALEYELDLVMWDIHDNACPKCQPYLGRVFSISGSSKVFPTLTVRPPVHPNCECTIHPITQEYLEDYKEYDKLVELSNDSSVNILGRDQYEQLLGRGPLRQAEKDADTLRKNKKDKG